MSSLRQLSEHCLGSIIKENEWFSAKSQAEGKLERIISREGDSDGIRLEPFYLAQLISEAVQSSRFSIHCYQMNEILKNTEKECACKADTPSYNNPILA